LNRQIAATFSNNNLKQKVRSVKNTSELLKAIKDKSVDILTTTIQKFDRIHEKYKNNDNNVFVLIDEAYRSQSGEAPNGCYNYYLIPALLALLAHPY
jgi:type I site-specific restriction-modification system R (restriction) subunit